MGICEAGAVWCDGGLQEGRMITPEGEWIGKFWDYHIPTPELRKKYIRSYDMQNPSRQWTLEQIQDGESLLDVGCGPGTVYEDIKNSGKDIQYTGIDVSKGFVGACKELFPEGDFRLGDASSLGFEDNSFDTVLLRHVLEHAPYYEDPIREAVRVAKRRVIIIMWKGLANGPDNLGVMEGRGSNDYNSLKFNQFLDSFVLTRTKQQFLGTQRPNWAWVLHKTQYETVFDLDDFAGEATNLDYLFNLRIPYPKLKVTLFTIPSRINLVLGTVFSKSPWIDLAVHGWTHEPNTECEEWTARQAHYYLNKAEKMGVFVKGFRPPGWRINYEVMDVLKKRGYWVSVDPVMGRYAEQIGLPNYTPHGDPKSVHGHMQDIHQDNPFLRNGLRQLIEERGLPWDRDTKFKFVSEMVR